MGRSNGGGAKGLVGRGGAILNGRMSERSGLLAGGNFIVDQVKIIDAYPEQDMLANIVSETSCNGGGPYNVLKDLAAMGASYPLEAAGLVGEDAPGEWVLKDCAAAGIDTRQLRRTGRAPTSYTDAMTVRGSGRRTFFHQRGANALLGEADFDFSRTRARWFHLAYLMLLDEMDRELPEGGTVAARVLAAAGAAGLQTSVDLVSTPHPRFRAIVEAALPFTDLLIVNEIEAGSVVGEDLRGAGASRLWAAAEALLRRGVRQQVVVHCAQGAVAVTRGGDREVVASLRLPEGFIAGATGAGDAFAAGYLHALHEGWPVSEGLRLAVCSAAACLSQATPSGGLRPVAECLKLGDDYESGTFE